MNPRAKLALCFEWVSYHSGYRFAVVAQGEMGIKNPRLFLPRMTNIWMKLWMIFRFPYQQFSLTYSKYGRSLFMHPLSQDELNSSKKPRSCKARILYMTSSAGRFCFAQMYERVSASPPEPGRNASSVRSSSAAKRLASYSI